MRPEGRDERSLVERCLRNDQAAQRELFHAHKRSVHQTLYRILGPVQDLEDLIQETFLQVFRSLKNFRHESSLATWTSRITTRVAFAHIRSRPKRLPVSEASEEVADTAALAGDRLEAHLALRSLYSVLDRIDDKRRVAYALHVIDGRPLAEVAELTGASKTAVKSQVWRARSEVNKRAKRDPRLARYLTDQGVMG